MMGAATGDVFLKSLAKSGLVSTDELSAVQQRAASGRAGASSELAAELVARGLLTEWQAAMLRSGQTEFRLGKYTLLAELGRGGMGAVFKARQAPLGRIVAVKVMASWLVSDPRAVARFHQEIQAAAALSSPYVVAALDADQVGQTHLLVMEYVDGESLNEVLAREGRLPIGVACEYARQAALGLHDASLLGMVHRDVKPGNLLITRADGEVTVKLLDMGLAKFTTESREEGELTSTGDIVGTPDYISPEQARSTKTADIRSDIFSLGCTLFRMLTGRLPYDGQNVMEKLMARGMQDARRVRAVRPEVPAALDEAIARMLDREPSRRFQTPLEVAEALRPWATLAPPESPATELLPRIPEPSDAGVASTIRLGSPEAETAQHFSDARKLSMATAGGEPTSRWVRASRPQSALRWKVAAIAAVTGTVLLAIAGFAIWSRKAPATITADWPEGERSGSRLEVDGTAQPLALKGPVQIVGPPGRRTLKLVRPGYEPVKLSAVLSPGQSLDFRPEWKPTAATRRAQTLAGFRRETADLLKTMPVVPKSLDAKTLSLLGRLAALERSQPSLAAEARKLRESLPSPLDPLRRDRIPQDVLRRVGQGDPEFASDSLVAVFGQGRLRHWNLVRSADVSPNGQTLYSAGDDGCVRVWNRATGKELRVFPDVPLQVQFLRMANEGESLLLAGNSFAGGSSIQRLDREEGRFTELAIEATEFREVAFSRAAKLVVAACGGSYVRIWNAESGEDVRTIPMVTRPDHVALSADGELGACDGGGKIHVWNPRTGEVLWSFQGFQNTVSSLQFSHDGRRLAAGGSHGPESYVLKLWNVVERKLVYERTDAGTFVLRFGPDDRVLAGAGPDFTVRLMEAATGNPLHVLSLNAGASEITFCDAGKSVITSGSDGRILKWDVESGTPRGVDEPPGHPGVATHVGFTPEGSRLISIAGDGSMVFRDLVSGETTVRDPLGGQPQPVVMSSDARHAARGAGVVTVFEIATGNLMYTEPAEEVRGARRAAFSHDGRWLAIGGEAPFLQCLDLSTGKRVGMCQGESTVNALALSPDGARALVITASEQLQVWSLPDCSKLRTLAVNTPAGVAFSPDGKTAASVGAENLVQLWDTGDWSQQSSFTPVHPTRLVSFDPSGRLLACTGEGSVTILETETVSLVESVRVGPRKGLIHHAAFSPDGRHLATANGNGTLSLFRLKAWTPPRTSEQ